MDEPTGFPVTHDKSGQRKRRPVKKRASPAVAKKRKMDDALSPGDQVEYGLTAELKHPRKGNWWVKAGGTTTIRQGETATDASNRLSTFFHNTIEEAANDLLDG